MQDFVSFCCLFGCFFFGFIDGAHFDFGNVNTDFDGHDEDCNYFSVSQYSNIVKTPKFFNQLAFVHFNIGSLPKTKLKIDSFLRHLSNDCLPAIITITGTKLSNANAKSVNIEDYSIYSNTLTHCPMLEV